MDLEMTGLDPARHVIVEIATLITDDDLEIVAEGPDLVVHQPPTSSSPSMDDVVRRDAHPQRPARRRSRRRPSPSRRPAPPRWRSCRSTSPTPRTVPLCGNSIGTDRRFLAAYLPEIENYLHYRSVDVSTLKELARRWNPEASSRRRARPTATGRSTTSARASPSCGSTRRDLSDPPASRPPSPDRHHVLV